eukprot:scaffold8225_cov52-Attheya_sp.AAC.1
MFKFIAVFMVMTYAAMEIFQHRECEPQQVTNKGEHCNKKLDGLDNQFNLQRSNRQEYVKKNGLQGDGKTIFDQFEPEAVCSTEERFGSSERFDAFHDGPKFVCGVDYIAKQPSCLVYSVGSNNEFAFEVGVKNFMGCDTYTFDPTVTKFLGDPKVTTFYPWGLGEDGKKDYNWISMSFETIINKLGHNGTRIDIIKIDCEGCEYTVMPPLFDAISKGTIQVDQIQIELHDGGGYKAIVNLFDAADNASMRVFHKERNHWGCMGYHCVEYAFVSESFLRKANADTIPMTLRERETSTGPFLFMYHALRRDGRTVAVRSLSLFPPP